MLTFSATRSEPQALGKYTLLQGRGPAGGSVVTLRGPYRDGQMVVRFRPTPDRSAWVPKAAEVTGVDASGISFVRSLPSQFANRLGDLVTGRLSPKRPLF